MDPAELWVGGDADDEGEDEDSCKKKKKKTECTSNSAWKRLKCILLIDLLIYLCAFRPIDASINHCHTHTHKVSHTPQNTITRVRCVITLRARREYACAKENEAVVLFVSAAGAADACSRLRGSRKNSIWGSLHPPRIIQVKISTWKRAVAFWFGLDLDLDFYFFIARIKVWWDKCAPCLIVYIWQLQSCQCKSSIIRHFCL